MIRNEHYRLAEKLLAQADEPYDGHADTDSPAVLLSKAQVHATLAGVDRAVAI